VRSAVRTVAYGRSDRVLWRRGFQSVLLLQPGRHEVVSLSGAGTALWELLATPRTVAEAADRLSGEYGVPADQVATDIAGVLEDLAKREILYRRESR
jgi:Coenzyme PQQ synthesis protein D (PqqD)